VKNKQSLYKWLYETYENDLFSYGIAFGISKELLEDAIHDVFLHLYEREHKLWESQNMKFYLLNCLKNRIRTIKKKEMNTDIDFNQVLANGALPMVATFADNFSKMVVTSNADWDEAHPAGTSLDDVLQVRINSSSDFVHDGYDMGEYKYEFLQNYDYLKTIEKRPSELTAADMKMVYYSLTDFSSQTKSPVIVFTSAPTLEKEHTLTLRWTTVEGDVKTASVTCTPEVDPALQ
jgi:DNA-directed RNA polymerase specialized sigma24 family protein